MRRVVVTLSCLLAAGAVLPAGACPDAAREWDRLQTGRVSVTLEARDDVRVSRGCALAFVPASVADVAAVVADAGSYAEFMPRVSGSTLWVDETGALLNEQHLDLPFPLQDRYYTVRLLEGWVDEGTWRLEWSYVPGSGNVADTRGSWLVEERGEGSLITYLVQTDPGGKTPRWAAELASRRSIPRMLEAVRRRVLELGTGASAQLGGAVKDR